ncbi:MFS transporter [Pseudomonas sp. NPDC007930]|uniref:MFS transporter n=1 Tax=Pseudomonas sp. NPDC007930 TaxID=3364417 RepID=UPI0036F1074B
MTQPPLPTAGAFVLLAVACLTIMVGCVIVPGLLPIAAALGVPSAAGWLVTLPALGVVLFGPLAAWLISRLGLHRALCLGLLGYGGLGMGGALAHGGWLVFTDRLLLGATTALVMAAGTGLLSAFYEGQARLAMIARQGMAIELGGVAFLFAGGVLAGWGWRWPFVLYASAWVLLLAVWKWVPVPAALPAEPGEGGPMAPEIKRVLASALLSLLVFFSAVILLPYLLAGQGYSEAQTGVFLAGVSLVAVAGAFIMPAVVRRLGEPGTLVLAFCAYAVAHGLFGVLPGLQWLAAVALGLGFGLSVPLVNHLVVALSPAALRGRNLAYLSMAIFSGQCAASLLESLPLPRHVLFGVAALLALATACWLVLGRASRAGAQG